MTKALRSLRMLLVLMLALQVKTRFSSTRLIILPV